MNSVRVPPETVRHCEPCVFCRLKTGEGPPRMIKETFRGEESPALSSLIMFTLRISASTSVMVSSAASIAFSSRRFLFAHASRLDVNRFEERSSAYARTSSRSSRASRRLENRASNSASKPRRLARSSPSSARSISVASSNSRRSAPLSCSMLTSISSVTSNTSCSTKLCDSRLLTSVTKSGTMVSSRALAAASSRYTSQRCVKLAPITEMGSAMMSTEAIMVTEATTLPSMVAGYESPYPTVISVTMHHQNDRGMEANGSPASASTASSPTHTSRSQK
mmetsp:Transcript_1044/g.4052  ORF Transcript_1044/g.4052 Transcript_1044/m.4052 type:complete len:279 (+) Transcript_1044:2301-3137(+)